MPCSHPVDTIQHSSRSRGGRSRGSRGCQRLPRAPGRRSAPARDAGGVDGMSPPPGGRRISPAAIQPIGPTPKVSMIPSVVAAEVTGALRNFLATGLRTVQPALAHVGDDFPARPDTAPPLRRAQNRVPCTGERCGRERDSPWAREVITNMAQTATRARSDRFIGAWRCITLSMTS